MERATQDGQAQALPDASRPSSSSAAMSTTDDGRASASVRAGAIGAIAAVAEGSGCVLCAGSRLVVVAHVAACLQSQWFDGAPLFDCADRCPRADCPACRAVAAGVRSE